MLQIHLLLLVLSVLQSHGKETRVVGSLVSKLFIFLQNFVTYDPQRASAMLQQYVQLLR